MIYYFNNCELNTERLVLSRDDDIQSIEPQALKVLLLLIDQRGKVLSRDSIFQQVWGHQYVSESTLSSCIKEIRKAVGDSGTRQCVIRTVRGHGYEFVAELKNTNDDESIQDNSLPSQALTRSGQSLSAAGVLIGREQLLSELDEAIGQHRLITLFGPGGVGKTSVANAISRQVSSRFSDGSVSVEMVRLARPESIVEACATALQVHVRREGTLENAVMDFLQSRHLLLVLDNCEHLIESVQSLAYRILKQAPHVTILATSREALGLAEEQLWPIEPLRAKSTYVGEEPEKYFDDLNKVPAIQLFVVRARSVDPYFQLDEKNANGIAEICEKLDGIPLAIELAASRARAIGITQISRRLNNRFKILGRSRSSDDPRHNALWDTIQWSYDLLNAEEQQFFLFLAVFEGQFDLEAVEATAMEQTSDDFDCIDLISRLVERSMVVVRQPSSYYVRYELLDSIREFGRQLLSTRALVQLKQKHCRYHARLCESVEKRLQGADEQLVLDQADGAFSDIRQAFLGAIETQDVDSALAIVCGLGEYAMRTMRYETLGWTDVVLTLADVSNHKSYAYVMALRAYTSWIRGDFQLALQIADQAFELSTGSDLAAGLVERVRANVLFVLGIGDAGLKAISRQLELAQESQNSSRMVHALYMKSIAVSSLADVDEGIAFANQALALAERTGCPTDIASALVARGFSNSLNSDRALQELSQADKLAQSVGNRWMSAFARTELGRLHIQMGDLKNARHILAEVIDIWFRAGEWSQQWLTLTNCIVVLNEMGQSELVCRSIGALEKRSAIGAPPVDAMLKMRALEIVSDMKQTMDPGLYLDLTAKGAESPINEIVQEIRSVFLA